MCAVTKLVWQEIAAAPSSVATLAPSTARQWRSHHHLIIQYISIVVLNNKSTRSRQIQIISTLLTKYYGK